MKFKLMAAGLAAALLASPAAIRPAAAQGDDFPELRVNGVDQGAVTRGRDVYAAQCASCHSQDQRGTRRGSDLSRSALLYNDTTGAALGGFLNAQHGQQVERVSFAALGEPRAKDLWSYLRASIRVIAARTYTQPSILVGDAKAGQTYFNGRGRCSTCHSPTGDFADIGGRYDMPTLQGYLLMPPRIPLTAAQRAAADRPGPPPAAPTGPPTITKNALRATIAASGQPPVTGQLMRLTQFEVAVADLQTGERRSWEIKDGQPKVTITDPLQGHDTVRRTITDTDMHNVMAYLAGLK